MIARVSGNGTRVGITGVGSYVPDRVLTNDEISRMVDTSDEWITTRTGIRERRIADPTQAASDLAVPAARGALEQAGVRAEDLDLVLVATMTPDMVMPATASLVATELGAHDAAAFDLSAACSGFVYGLAQAYGTLAGGLGRRALVVGSEALSRIINWQDRGTCVLFGDGAGAVVLERVEAGGFLGFELGSDGAGGEHLCIPAGGSRNPASPETVAEVLHTFRMNGQEIFRFGTRVLVDSAQKLLAACEVGLGDVDVYVPHQANKRIIDHAVKNLGLDPRKVVVNLDRYGNTSAASIPLCLEEAVAAGTIEPGSTVLMTGIGGGLSWGSALVEWTGPTGA